MAVTNKHISTGRYRGTVTMNQPGQGTANSVADTTCEACDAAMARTYAILRKDLRKSKANCHDIGNRCKILLGNMLRPRNLYDFELWIIPGHEILYQAMDLQDIFESNPGHQIYVLTFRENGDSDLCKSAEFDHHTVVVERCNEQFRIYQAWGGEYTFDQWVDCPANATGDQVACERFGSSHILDRRQINEWLRSATEVFFFHERVARVSENVFGAAIKLMSRGCAIVEKFPVRLHASV